MTQETHDTPERPRPLTDAEVDALRDEMKDAIAWAQAKLCRRDHTPNALTAETLRKSATRFKVDGGVDELMAELEAADKPGFQAR